MELRDFFENILKRVKGGRKGGKRMKTARVGCILEVVGVLGLFLGIVL